MLTIEIFSRFSWKKLTKQWYFRIRARNGEILTQSEGYRNRVDALATVKMLRTELPTAEIREGGPSV